MRRFRALLAVSVFFAGAASAQLAGWQDLEGKVLAYAAGAGDASNIVAWTGDPFQPAPTPITLVRSSDGGRTWTPSDFPRGVPPGGSRLHADPTDGRVFYLEWMAGSLGDSVALYKTSDAGATWELVNPLMQTPW